MRGLFVKMLGPVLLLASTQVLASSWTKSCENPASETEKSTYRALAKFTQKEWQPKAESCAALETELLKVKFIDIRQDEIKDLAPVFALTHITQLIASGNAISSIEGIESLKDLELLDLGDNAIDNIKPLVGLKKLTQLRLAKNQIKDAQVLVEMTQLEKLSLAYNKIQSIAEFTALQKLNYLSIASNDISSIESLKNLKQLLVLNLSFNRICKADDWNGFASKDIKVVGRDNQTCQTTPVKKSAKNK